MKKIRSRYFIVMLFVVFIISTSSANADLYNRGTDILGNRLLYDSDLNITWYDFTKSKSDWQTQMNWADGLDVDFDGSHYTDWRLPTTVDAPYVFGYDGTTTAGFNITSSEMGHLFYTELGNKGYWDTFGNPTGCSGSSPYCLTNTGDFQNLQPVYYWSGTESVDGTHYAWRFYTDRGFQSYGGKDNVLYALAVRLGDVAVVPEPLSSILFVTGGSLLAGRRYIKRNKKA